MRWTTALVGGEREQWRGRRLTQKEKFPLAIAAQGKKTHSYVRLIIIRDGLAGIYRKTANRLFFLCLFTHTHSHARTMSQ